MPYKKTILAIQILIISKLKIVALIAFCLFLSRTNFFAQDNRGVDSILTLLKTAKEDSIKVGHFIKLCWEYKNLSEFEKGLEFGSKAVNLAKKLNYKKGEVAALNNIAVIYYSSTSYPKALDNYFEAYRIASEIGDKKQEAAILGNMGVIYDEQQNYPKALEYYAKSQEIAKTTKDKNLLANNYNNMGGVYLNQNDLKTALDYFLKGLQMKQELGNKTGVANSLLNIGTLYYNLEDFQKTMKYFLYALKLKEELNNKAGIATVCGNIGALYVQMGRFDRAEGFLLRSLAIAEEIHSYDDMSNAHLNLSDLYDTTKKLSQSLFHYKKYKACQDTIFNEEKSKDIGRLEARSDFDKQQAVSNAEHKKELELADEREKRQALVSYSVGAGLLLVLLFALFIFNRFRVIRKQNIIIEHQKKIVEEKQKETMDSIYYAKRIQGSLLTSELYFDKELNRLNKN